jgi:hypothetical protein
MRLHTGYPASVDRVETGGDWVDQPAPLGTGQNQADEIRHFAKVKVASVSSVSRCKWVFTRRATPARSQDSHWQEMPVLERRAMDAIARRY